VSEDGWATKRIGPMRCKRGIYHANYVCDCVDWAEEMAKNLPANVRRAAIEECLAVVDDYAARANVKGLHVQNDTARFLADALRALLGDES